MHALTMLANEGIKNRDLWYPTILGVLVVISAVALFCGTPYLLLATNMGSRLGFLIASAGLAGFMVLLSLLWLTTLFLDGKPDAYPASSVAIFFAPRYVCVRPSRRASPQCPAS